MGLRKLKSRITIKNLSPLFGLVKKISPTHVIGSGLNLGIGDTVRIHSRSLSRQVYGMVTEIDNDDFVVTPFGFIEGFRNGDHIFVVDKGLRIPVGEELLGRVLNPFMEPLDGKEAPATTQSTPIMQPPIEPMKRGLIDKVISTGVKSIDGLLTCGLGQKMGIFAGSGVGKSTLMGMIVKGSDVPIKVIALIGERGREIPEFVENNLGGDLTNTVIITATSDDSPLMRKYGAFSAMAVAEYFKNQGQDVLFIMDSVTRFAMAQREIGLSLGEPPTTKGYPPSVFSILPQLMERAGKEEGKGTITAFFTVLIEGDDMNDPIADQARSILDGHIVLSREMTDYGIYPPVNVLSSASRLFNDLNDEEHILSAQTFRKLYALLKENEVLIRIGAYTTGTDAELDNAISKKEILETFLKQTEQEKLSFEDTKELLTAIFSTS